MATQLLPSRPDLEQLKRQAKEFLRAWKSQEPAALAALREFLPSAEQTAAPKLATAQWLTARRYSFRSWARLKQFVETSTGLELSPAAIQLRQAIDADRTAEIAKLLDESPDLIDEHVARSPNSYRNQRPLAYACQAGQVKAVALLLERGADPAEDGYLAVARAAMRDNQLPVLRLLFGHVPAGGGERLDANVEVYHWGPLLLYPCECLAPGVIRFLLEQGADPNRRGVLGGCKDTPLEMVLGTYGRSPAQADCIEALIAGGARYEDGPVMDLHRNRLESLSRRIDAEPALVHQRFYGLTYGATGGRRLTADGGTLLHVAAEFCHLDAARLLLDRGAAVNARTMPVGGASDATRNDGATPLFLAATQYNGWGLPLVQLLLDRDADRTLTATVPGTHDRPEEILTCTALGYAKRFPDKRPASDTTLALLGP